MTKVARLFEEEKLEAVEEERQKGKVAIEEERQKAITNAKQTAMELLKDGDSIEKVVRCVGILSMNEVKALQAELTK